MENEICECGHSFASHNGYTGGCYECFASGAFCGKFHSTSDTPLELTIIDFGESCYLRVEKNDRERWIDLGTKRVGLGGGVQCSDEKITNPMCKTYHTLFEPFAAIRAAIDAEDEKPMPRIEQRDVETMLNDYYILCLGGDNNNMRMSFIQYDALCELAGKTLDIYEPKERGEWTQLYNKNAVAMVGYSLPFDVHRYVRK